MRNINNLARRNERFQKMDSKKSSHYLKNCINRGCQNHRTKIK